jgi:hypothetical protein
VNFDRVNVTRPENCAGHLRGALLFHEPWWLSATSGSNYCEAIVKRGEKLVGRLPFVSSVKMGFRRLVMPPFTHVLGPIIDVGGGKPDAQLRQCISIIRELVDQLPAFDFFQQACTSSTVTILAFQECGFDVRPQCNFQLDCRTSLISIWERLNVKTRGHIRRAQTSHVIASVDNPSIFISFYLDNMKRANRSDRMAFERFHAVFSESRERDCGDILAAYGLDGAPAAMVYLVWGRGIMYYLLSTRNPDIANTGAVNLLLWSAIQRAHERELVFDFDGVINSGQMRFLLGFGGQLSTRLIVTRAKPLFRLARYANNKLFHGHSKENARFYQ